MPRRNSRARYLFLFIYSNIPAYARLMQMGGLSTEWTYPYNSYFGDNFQCNNSRVAPVATLSNYSVLPSNVYEPLLNHVATVGPLVTHRKNVCNP